MNQKQKFPTPDDLERIRAFQLSMIKTTKEASFALERLSRALVAGAAAFQRAFEKELARKRPSKPKIRNPSQ